jgi:hypothetical protein
MSKKMVFCLWVLLCLACKDACAQSVDSVTGKVLNFPSRFLSSLHRKTADLDQQLTRQTEKYLARMAKREQQLHKKLAATDSVGAKTLFAGAQQKYAALLQKIRTDTGSSHQLTSGQYQPYADSLQGMLGFLKQNPKLLSSGSLPASGDIQARLQSSTAELQQLQARMKDADQIKAYVQQRKQQIGQYIAQHVNAENLLGKSYAGLNQDAYYYSQQISQYKQMLNDPDQMERKALAQLGRLPAFQTFMKNNSQLAGLFGLPGNSGPAQALAGLQTRDQVTQQVQGQVSAAGSGGMDALQSNLQSAQSQLDGYKNKLGQFGAGSGDADIPDFRPNDQKTKTFWKRLEYGVNFQTTHNNYYFPIVTDLGLSLGYKLGHNNLVGVGASYKLGWGSGFQHIALSSEGVGLRSFLEIQLKGSFSATGGFEYNYTTPFTGFQQLKQLQYWTKSGLIGISKSVSMNSRVLKKTKVQLLWDFLSYQQVPKTQPILFRIGYNF